MCGLNAFFSYTKVNQSQIDKIKLSNQDMIYRGPNEQDVWHNENIVLGQVRLSIIGVNNGHQPLFNEDKNLVLICNGEIYNYLELKKMLIEKGHKFRYTSDSEVILHLYEEYKEDLNSKLDGMFAYCLYDIKNNKLLVGRDTAGMKPLYYAKTSEGVVFSSELKVIKKYFLKGYSLNYEVLRQTQKFTHSISRNQTYIDEIYKLPYGSYASISQSNDFTVKISSYFKRDIQPVFNGDYQEACNEIKRLLYKAVEKRLQSEVPLGILLSAGIDSSAIATIAKEFREEVHVLSAGYSGKHDVDERKEAKRLSDEMGFIWNEIELNENYFNSNFNKIMSVIDEPNGDVAMFAQWEIYKKAKSLGFTVLLSGNGGDELFYGYDIHNNYALGLDWLKYHKMNMPILQSKQSIKYTIYNLYKTLIRNRRERILSKINTRNDYPVHSKLEKMAIKQYIPLDRADWHRINYSEMIDNVYHFLHYAWLTNNCYFLADKLAMANSIEVRSPFADIELIKFIDTLPLSFKFKNQKPKQILKDSLKGVLPDYVLQRKKSGFAPPDSFVNNLISKHSADFTSDISTFPQLVTDFYSNR